MQAGKRRKVEQTMSPGNDRTYQKRRKPTESASLRDLTQLRTDLAGLERLQAIQSQLISEIRRQVSELQAALAK